MVGGSQAQPVSETQAAPAADIKRVAVGDSLAFAIVVTGQGVAWVWVLTSIAYKVTGTPANRQ